MIAELRDRSLAPYCHRAAAGCALVDQRQISDWAAPPSKMAWSSISHGGNAGEGFLKWARRLLVMAVT